MLFATSKKRMQFQNFLAVDCRRFFSLPSPTVFFFVLDSALALLNLLSHGPEKKKHTKKIQLHMLNNHNQSLISFGWCYPLDKLSLSRGGSTPVSTVLWKSVRFFIINIFLIIIIIELSKLKSGKWSGQMFSFSSFWALDRNPGRGTN